MTTMKQPPNGAATAWIKYLGAVSSLILTVVLAPTITVLVYRSVDHGNRIAVIESNRFTSADAMKVYEMISAKADKQNVPPPEVKQALVRLERDVREIRAMLAQIRAVKRGDGAVSLDFVPPGMDD